ncbi:MAG: luciferase family protein [Planctomycetota bacterium]
MSKAQEKLRIYFADALSALPTVKVDLWKDSDLLCVFYRGKEFAHFHAFVEIDVRLSRAFIKAEGITPLENSPFHTDRSPSSRWVQFEFRSKKQVDGLVEMIKKLIKQEYQGINWGKK